MASPKSTISGRKTPTPPAGSPSPRPSIARNSNDSWPVHGPSAGSPKEGPGRTTNAQTTSRPSSAGSPAPRHLTTSPSGSSERRGGIPSALSLGDVRSAAPGLASKRHEGLDAKPPLSARCSATQGSPREVYEAKPPLSARSPATHGFHHEAYDAKPPLSARCSTTQGSPHERRSMVDLSHRHPPRVGVTPPRADVTPPRRESSKLTTLKHTTTVSPVRASASTGSSPPKHTIQASRRASSPVSNRSPLRAPTDSGRRSVEPLQRTDTPDTHSESPKFPPVQQLTAVPSEELPAVSAPSPTPFTFPPRSPVPGANHSAELSRSSSFEDVTSMPHPQLLIELVDDACPQLVVEEVENDRERLLSTTNRQKSFGPDAHLRLSKGRLRASCPQCGNFVDNEDGRPLMLKCGHSFCTSCCSALIKGGAIQCPSCDSPTDLHGQGLAALSTNYAFIGLAELSMKGLHRRTTLTVLDEIGATCPICLEGYHAQFVPCMLSCGHSMCRNCCEMYKEACPQCGAKLEEARAVNIPLQKALEALVAWKRQVNGEAMFPTNSSSSQGTTPPSRSPLREVALPSS
eukprot:GGOE01008381.1.p1 GENE.GGOE01008381.1~~GGOE01008381.1.p1  ORF type:complete len:663 (+),score=43.51 GGOE01008381.1:270-1991(+)